MMNFPIIPIKDLGNNIGNGKKLNSSHIEKATLSVQDQITSVSVHDEGEEYLKNMGKVDET